MTNEGQTQQPVAGGRDAATQRLLDDYSRQCQELREELSEAFQRLDYWQRRCVEAEGAAAADSAKATLAPKTAFAAAPGSGALTWLARPTRAGWWWWCNGDEPRPTIVKVHGRADDLTTPLGQDCARVGGRWAGPYDSRKALLEAMRQNVESSD